jgi:glycosyltransferase involved in cell wall biosynthesis
MTNYLETGGTERQFAALARALRPEAFQVQLGCLRRAGAFLKGIEQIAEFDLGGSFFNLQAQRARIALARDLRARKVAIAHSFDFYSNLMLIPTARLAGVPVVIGSQRQMGDLLTVLQFGALAAVFHLCDRVVCNSRAARSRLLAHGLPEQTVTVIPNGLSREAFAPTPPALPRRPGTARVGMIARMNHAVKDHAAFLRAAARLAARFPALEFVLVGDGFLRPELERLAAKLGLGERARFLGERHDVPAVLAALDIFVLPSSSESLPNAILEAMAAGLPVVAPRVGGIPELVTSGETGLLVPPNDDDRLVEALEFLLTRPSLAIEWGRRAQRLALANFTIEQVRDRYEQLYLTLLAEKDQAGRSRSRQAKRHGSGG